MSSLDERIDEILRHFKVVHDEFEPCSAKCQPHHDIKRLILRAVQSERLAAVADFAEKILEETTFAQWVLERQEPIGFDKEVVRVEAIREALATYKGDTNDNN